MADTEKIIGLSGAGCCLISIFPLIVGIILVISVLAFATSGGDTETAGNGTGATCIGPGSLETASGIPEELKTIFSSAGCEFTVAPAFVSAIFYVEHGKSYPTHGPWASSPVGASGPFQFMPATWESNKQDGNGDGVKDIQNLWDSSFAASHLLAANGARNYTDDLDRLRDAASKYNSGQPWSIGKGYSETARYVPIAIDEYKRITSSL